MQESLRAVLFDAVGTLIRTVPDVYDVYAAAGRRFGSRHAAAAIQARFRPAFKRHDGQGATSEQHERARWRNIVTEVFDDIPDSIDPLFTELWDHFADPGHWALYHDVLPTWKSLRERNCVIGIASNFDSRLEAIRRAIHPLDDADHLFCSSAIGFQKPHPEFYARVQQELRCAPHQILMVGDNLTNDVQAAHAAGWQAIWIQRDGAPSDDLIATQLSQPLLVTQLSQINELKSCLDDALFDGPE